MRKSICHIVPAAFCSVLAAVVSASCHYDETPELCPVHVRLVYPEGSNGPYAGARVELKDVSGSVFVDSSDVSGVALFTVPPGIYAAGTSSVYLTDDYRYIFNGQKSMIVVSPDSVNDVRLKLTMVRKRIVH